MMSAFTAPPRLFRVDSNLWSPAPKPLPPPVRPEAATIQLATTGTAPPPVASVLALQPCSPPAPARYHRQVAPSLAVVPDVHEAVRKGVTHAASIARCAFVFCFLRCFRLRSGGGSAHWPSAPCMPVILSSTLCVQSRATATTRRARVKRQARPRGTARRPRRPLPRREPAPRVTRMSARASSALTEIPSTSSCPVATGGTARRAHTSCLCGRRTTARSAGMSSKAWCACRWRRASARAPSCAPCETASEASLWACVHAALLVRIPCQVVRLGRAAHASLRRLLEECHAFAVTREVGLNGSIRRPVEARLIGSRGSMVICLGHCTPTAPMYCVPSLHSSRHRSVDQTLVPPRVVEPPVRCFAPCAGRRPFLALESVLLSCSNSPLQAKPLEMPCLRCLWTTCKQSRMQA